MEFLNLLLGPVLGVVGGYITREQDMKAKKIDNEFNLKKFEHEVTMRKEDRQAAQEANEQAMAMNHAVTESDLATTVVEGSYAGLLESIKADAAMKTDTFMDGFRSSVRPVLTYVSVLAAIFMIYTANTPDIAGAASATVLTNAGLAFAWWFGDRQAVKLNSKYLK